MPQRAWILLITLLAACGGDLTAPPTPTLDIQAVTLGDPADPDGYRIQIDGGHATTLGINAGVRVTDLVPGSHQVELEGVAPNCTVAGPNPRSVSVGAGDVVPVRFDIQCGAPSGSLDIVVTTTGEEPDPDGYLVSLDGAPGVAVVSGGPLSIASVAAGQHQIRVGGIAPNCIPIGPNPRVVTVGLDPLRVDLEIHCSHPAGTLQIAIVTAGPQPDPDGYDLTVAGATRHVASTATLSIPDVPVGDIEVRLDGLASNCRLEGDNPRRVTVAIRGFLSLTFAVSCLPASDGLILFASNRSGASHVYRVRQDGTDLRDLTPGLEAAGGDWSPDGSHIVFSHPTHGDLELMVMDADGGHRTSLGVQGARPRWSPDGRTIVFTAPGGVIAVIGADGSGARQLVEGGNPDWSPDGTRIAFDRVDRSQCVFDLFCASSIYAVRADGTGETVVAAASGAADHLSAPDWSPDGRHIAYTRGCCAFGPDLGGLYFISASGGFPRQLGQAHGVRSGPIWSPDGTILLVAAGSSFDAADLTMVPVDGGTPVALARAAGYDLPQAWR